MVLSKTKDEEHNFEEALFQISVIRCGLAMKRPSKDSRWHGVQC